MVEVIDISQRLREKQEDQKLDNYYENHDYVLDACEEVFDEAIIVALVDKEIQMSSTSMDNELMMEMLLSALIKLKEVSND